jgi:hypothetical protein
VIWINIRRRITVLPVAPGASRMLREHPAGAAAGT